jgi:hypothetical protein
VIRPSSLRTLFTPARLAALLVSLAPLVYFQAGVRGQVFLAPFDGVLFHIPLRVAAANMISRGYLPLWNPYIFGGMPLHASAQGGLLFPLNWFFFIFDAQAATNLMSILAYMLAALGAFLLARKSGASITGSVVTSVIYQSCGFLVGQISHVNIVQTAALLPWLLWSVESYATQGDRKYGLAIAAVVGLQAFTGHQQTLAYSLLLAGAYAVVMWRTSARVSNRYLTALLLLVSGLLLAAVQILPTYELMRNSLRSAASFDFFTAFSLPPTFILTFVAPYVMGGGDGRLFRAAYVGQPFYGEFIGYVGLAGLMLAIVAVAIKRDTHTKFWAAVVVIALAAAIGGYWPFKLYAIVYYVPILNLFRAPARHMMEIDLALALLAGRGFTALAVAGDRRRAVRVALFTGTAVFLLTCLAVTVGRPAAFRLAREAPVTLLRAPELFLPIAFALLSAYVLWRYASRQTSGSLCLLVVVLVVDLCVWGQSSGWRVASPTPDHPLWRRPTTLAYLQDHDALRKTPPYRILTAELPFDPNQKITSPANAPAKGSVLWLQPNIYMMHGVENASGYDGFGLARYSRLAGDMTVSGELPDPERVLNDDGCELDLINVRYLFALRVDQQNLEPRVASSPSIIPATTATESYGGEPFATADLGLPSLKPGELLTFDLPATEADRIAVLTNLSWAVDVPERARVGRIKVIASDGRSFEFELLAGRDTAEWAHDRSDIKSRVRHARAIVATSYEVESTSGTYSGHSYVASFKFPERISVKRIEIESLAVPEAPELTLTLLRASIATEEKALPLPREWTQPARSSRSETRDAPSRWRHVGETEGVVIYESARALPRAWLAPRAVTTSEQATLDAIRTKRLPDGATWDPRLAVLVEHAIPQLESNQTEASGQAEVARHEPNRVDVKTESSTESILVLSENYYPGWRVYVDGRRSEVLRVNYNQRGVLLTAGRHDVSFVYRPWSVLIGLIVSALTGAALIMWWYVGRESSKSP